MIEEKYNSLQEEVEANRRKLKKVWGKLKSARAEIKDLTEEFQDEREDLMDTVLPGVPPSSRSPVTPPNHSLACCLSSRSASCGVSWL